MKKAVMLIAGLMMTVVTALPAYAVTDGYYNLTETAYTWDGTDADRTKVTSVAYDYGYGDEEILTYSLPWAFNYYSQSYSSINIDSNGNIWFGYSGSANSFNLQNTGHGPVIAAWNNDLSSQYYGGAFVQHKTNPERVVIEWQTETYSEEGSNLLNNFEVVLYQTGEIRLDYKSFDTTNQDDFGSGLTRGDDTIYSNIGPVYNLANHSFITSLTNTPYMWVTPQSADYETKIGTSVSKTFTVANLGSGALQISSAHIIGEDGSVFTKISDTCGETLIPLQTCSIQVAFAPVSSGQRSAALSLSSNDPYNAVYNIPLSGKIVYDLNIIKNGMGYDLMTVDSSPAGISCGAQCLNLFIEGTEITLTAAHGSETIFNGWSGSVCSGTGSCIFTITGDTTVTVEYTTPFVYTTPVSDSSVNTAQVGYTLADAIASGNITYTRTGGTVDAGSPHVYNFVSADMTSGSHTVNTGISLASGAIYTVDFNATIASGLSAFMSNINVTYNAADTVATLVSPANNSKVNDAVAAYTLSRNITSGKIVFTRTGGNADGLSPHTYTLSGAELSSGNHNVSTGLTLVDGAVYTVSMENINDASGNPTANVANSNVTYDPSAVYITNTSPVPNSQRNTTSVGYTLSAEASSGKVIFTRTGGNADGNSPHVYAMTGDDLSSGTHTINTSLPLVDGALYTVSFDAGDMSGNPATIISNAGIMFDTTPPTITATSGSTEIDVSAGITATFSEAIDPVTLNGANFTINGVTGTVTYNSDTRTATFIPSAYLAYYTTYTATIATGVKDLAGNNIIASTTWTFKTARRQVSWYSAVSGNWSDSTKWKDLKKNVAVVPTSTDDVIINAAGTYIVTLDTNATVNSINVGGTGGTTLSANGKTLTINFASTVGSKGALSLNSSTISGTGPLTNQGSLTISTSTINTAFDNQGTLNIISWTNINGIFAQNGTLRLDANQNTGSPNLTVANGLTNSGSIQLVVNDAYGRYPTLTVTNGTLTNVLGATIEVQSGSGTATSYLNAQINNQGTITINKPLYSGRDSSVSSNSGTINVNDNLSLYQSGTSSSFTNTGTISIASGKTFSVSGGTFTNASAGILQGSGTLSFSSATFSNAGNVNPGSTLGKLSITGNLPLTSTSAINIEIGGRSAGTSYDQLAVSGTATLSGALNVSLINGFTPTVGDSFTILTYGSKSGTFSAVNLPAFTGGYWAVPTYNSTSLVLSVVPDTMAPTGSISINSGAQSTNNPVVTLTLSCADSGSGCVQMQLSNDNTDWSPAETYATTKTWTLTSGDGSKTVYVKFKDNAGNWSAANSADITLDAAAPIFTSTSPVPNAFVNTATVGYSLSKAVASGSVTFIWTGGTADAGSPHVYNFVSADMTAGSHTVNTGLSLVNGAIYTVSFDASDSAGNPATTVANTDIVYDTVSASVVINGPASSSRINNAIVSYTLSETIINGEISFSRTDGTADILSPHTYTLSGAELTAGQHMIDTGMTLVDGSIYSVSFENVTDQTGNQTASISNTGVTYDLTSVAITGTRPSSGTTVAAAIVSYSLSEQAQSGNVTFNWTGGTPDSGSPHIYALAGSELYPGTQTVNTGLPLVGGAIYTVSFDAIDMAGNAATTVSNANVLFDATAPTVTATSPITGATGVDITSPITAIFSEVMDAATINGTNFTIDNGVTGTVTYNSETKTATFTPSALAYSTTYTATITAGATDMAGNSVAANYSWSFTTDAIPSYALSIMNTGTGTGSVTSTPSSISCGGTCTNGFNLGTVVTLTATPDVSSTFTGWSGACAGTGTCVVTMDAAKSVTATFAINMYSLNYTADSNGSITGTGSQTVNYGANGSQVTAVPSTGYHFVAWSDGLTANPRTETKVSANISVTATFAINTYTVTLSAGANGTISPTTTQTVNYNGATSFTVAADTGYQISSVTGCGGTLVGSTYTTEAITSDCVVVATFADVTAPTGTITINSNETYANSTNVTLAITCSDPGSGCSQMILSNDSVFDTEVAESYVASKTWVLSTGDGAKPVYVKFQDGAGNWSGVYSANIALDTVAPSFTSIAPAANAFVNMATVGYSLSENVTSGSITFTWDSGTADAGSAHVYNFVSTDMTAGTHTINTNLSLVSGAVYTVSFDAIDMAGNAAATVSNNSVAYDTTATAVTMTGPAAGSRINNANVVYNLSENITAGDIVFTWTGGNADSLSPHTYTLSGTELASGSHSISTDISLVDGAVYSVSIESITDQAGNLTANVSNVSVAYDSSAVTITNTIPSAGSILNSPTVSYNLSEQAQSGKVTFTWTGGAHDAGSPHIYALAASELYSGIQTVNTGVSLVDGAIYTVSFDAIDMAGNSSTTVSNAMISYDDMHDLSAAKTGTGGGSITGDIGTIICGTTCMDIYNHGTVVILTASSDTSSIFTGWSGGGCSGTENCTVTLNGDTTVTAAFTLKSYGITATADANGSITPSGTVLVSHGSDQTFLITPNSGYGIAAIVVDDMPLPASAYANSSYTFNHVTATHTISTAFARNAFAVTGVSGGNGAIAPSPQTINYGSMASFTLIPNTGYHIESVTGCGGTLSGNSYTTGPIVSDCTVNAIFAINTYTLAVNKSGTGAGTVTSAPSGISCGTSCTDHFVIGTAITLTAEADTGSAFVGWSGNCGTSSGNSYSISSLTVDCTVSAKFTYTSPVLTLSTLPNGAVTGNSVLNIVGSATDDTGIASLTIALNGTVETLTEGEFNYAVQLAEGTNTITVTATDADNNQAVDTRVVTLNSIAPFLVLPSIADNSLVNESYVNVAGSVGDGATVQIRVNGGDAKNVPVTGGAFATTVNLASDRNTIEITATDTSGNKNTLKRTVTYDALKPFLAIIDPIQDMETVNNSYLLSGTIGNAPSDVVITVNFDGQTYNPVVTNGEFQQVLTFREDKIYLVTLTASDGAGNILSSVQRNIIHHSVTLTASPASPQLAGTPVTFTAGVNNGGENYEYKFWLKSNISSTWAAVQDYSATNTWTWDTAIYGPGIHNIMVYARNAGSTATYESYKVIDFAIGSMPTLTVNSSNGTQTYLSDTLISGTANSSVGLSFVSVNGQTASYRPSDGYYELNVSLNSGANAITVVATDIFGDQTTSTITVTRMQPPDLVISTVSGPTNGVIGTNISVTNTVCNNGPGDSGAFDVGLYLSSDNTITTGDTFIGSIHVASLGAGQCSAVTTTVGIPSNVAVGTYYIGAIADYGNMQYESAKTNNALAGNHISVTHGFPDLLITQVAGPASVKMEQQVTVTFKVKNKGLGSAVGFNADIYLSTDSAITTNDTFLGNRYFDSLTPGTELTVNITVTIPTELTSATYYIGVIADASNLVTESDETNNAFAGRQIAIRRQNNDKRNSH